MTNTIEKVYKNGTEYSFKDPNVNTKTFTLSWTSDLTTAQAIYDYYVAWNNPIMKQGTISYTCGWVFPTEMTMTATETLEDHSSNSYTSLYIHTFVFALNSWTVTGITTADGDLWTYLSIGAGYSTPYIPTSDGDPATKKYVDDAIWAIPPSWIQNDTTWTTTTVTKIRAGTEAEYALITPDANTIYHIY